MKRVRCISVILIGLMLTSSPMVVLADYQIDYHMADEQNHTDISDEDELDIMPENDLEDDNEKDIGWEEDNTIDDLSDEVVDEECVVEDETQIELSEDENQEENDENEDDASLYTNGVIPNEIIYVDAADVDVSQIIDPDDFLGLNGDGTTEDCEEDLGEQFTNYYGASKWAKYSCDYFYHKLPSDSYKKWWLTMQKICDGYLDGTTNIVDETTAYVKIDEHPSMSSGFLTEMFISSNPQYYFLKNTTCVMANSNAMVVYSAFCNGNDRKKATDKMFSAVNSWLSEIKGSTEAEKLRKIHSVICAKVSYNRIELVPRDPEFTQSAYSAYVLNKTVCMGYTKATTLLCNASGIHATGVVGDATGPHAWNKVCVNGIWYNVDNTWDDKSTLSYTYFGRSDSKLASHTQEARYNAYAPTCNTDSGSTSSKVGFTASHSHSSGSLVKKNSINPTCGEDGANSYYYCATCGKAYKSSAGTPAYEIKIGDLLVNKTGKHTWKESNSSYSKNCEVSKTVDYYCTVCGETKRETIPAKAHTYVKGTTIYASCLKEGTQIYTCTKCNATKREPIPAIGYHYWIVCTTVTPKNCVLDGTKYLICTECNATKNEPIPAKGSHSWIESATVNAKDCMSEGTKNYICTECNATKREPIPAKGYHDYVKDQTTTITSCLYSYYETYTCSACGDKKKERMPAIGAHDYVKDLIDTPYKCDESHYEIYTCKVCKNQKKEFVAAKSHTWGIREKVDTTDTEEGYIKTTCMVCGTVKKESLDNWLHLTWLCIEDKSYWYENDVRQGTQDDPKGVMGFDAASGKQINRGREICDIKSNGWYWLDSEFDGAKAVNKEVWIPYIYQEEVNWSEDEIWQNANASGTMAQQVHDAILCHGKEGAGKWVRYNANGAMVKGWYTVEGTDCSIYPNQIGNTYYYDNKTGLMAKGWTNIDGVNYYFDEVTGVLIR